jgi:hypothetical protein
MVIERESPTFTKSQVNRAGRTIRRWLREEAPQIDDPKLGRALSVVLNHRAAHQAPLSKATMGLRSMVRSEGCQVEVSQRLKRITTIIDKLRREPTMALGNMQDIGGCRAVLASTDDVRKVEQRLKKNRPPVAVADYIAAPRVSGYRAVHVVVCYEDRHRVDRLIEVQLRTRAMHEWAIEVERWGGRLRIDLKGGEGPPEVLDFLRVVSQAMAIEEAGDRVPDDLFEQWKQLRAAAVPFLTGS